MSKAEFVRIDRDAVLDFDFRLQAGRGPPLRLLGRAGASATSGLFYLRTKGQLEEGLKALGFERLSLFQPSMILTPTNRYGVMQAITLVAFPWLEPLLIGPSAEGSRDSRRQAWRGDRDECVTQGTGVGSPSVGQLHETLRPSRRPAPTGASHLSAPPKDPLSCGPAGLTCR